MRHRGISLCLLAMYGIASLILSIGSAEAEMIVAVESMPLRLISENGLMTAIELFGINAHDTCANGCSSHLRLHSDQLPSEFPSNSPSIDGLQDGCCDDTNSTSNNRSSSGSAILCWLLHLKQPTLLERLLGVENWKTPCAPTIETLRPS